MNTPSGEPEFTREEENTIIEWLQRNALPLEHLQAGSGFADLLPLKQILKDVKVVGLGETTHGTCEVFLLKHRLVEFLVTEMAFTTFTIEASFAACQPINEYVLYGKGELAAVLTGQFYIPWDTEEFSALLIWLRAYNLGRPDGQKVRFEGLDITRNDTGRQVVLDYLAQVGSDQSTLTQTLFAELAPAEGKWPRRMTEETKKTLAGLLPRGFYPTLLRCRV